MAFLMDGLNFTLEMKRLAKLKSCVVTIKMETDSEKTTTQSSFKFIKIVIN